MTTNKAKDRSGQAPAKVHYLPRPHATAEDRKARRKRRKGNVSPQSQAAFRVAELNRWFTYRYGQAIIMGVIDDVEMMLHVLARLRNPEMLIENWLGARAPWFKDKIAIARILKRPIWFGADAIARKVGLTYDIRQQLNIRTIGATDKNKRERNAIRIAKMVEAKRNKRRAGGKTPRKEFEALSLAKQKPWVTLGISRATWFRKFHEPAKEHPETSRKTIETGVGAIILYTTAVTPVSNQTITVTPVPNRRQVQNISVSVRSSM